MAPCWRKWDSPERTGRRETEQDGRDVQAYTPHLLKSVTQGFCGGVGWSKYLVLSVARHVVPLPFPHTKISSFPGQTYKFKIGVGLTVTTVSIQPSSPVGLKLQRTLESPRELPQTPTVHPQNFRVKVDPKSLPFPSSQAILLLPAWGAVWTPLT